VYAGAKVAVIVPAYRESKLIEKTLAGIPPIADAIYVVDDASDDDTWETLCRVEDKRVSCLRHEQNLGVGAAIVSGYQKAISEGADILVVMAGDNQMDPADLPALLTPIAEGRASYVKGNRFRHRTRRAMPFGRRLAGKTLSALTRFTTGLNVDDTQCGYTALDARSAQALPLATLWPRYGYPNDLLALLAHGGFTVAEVPVRPVYADEKSGIRPWHALTIAGLIVKRWRELRSVPRSSKTPD
jgi:glycosyltransferase involved in cell wall biosynthesis